MTTKPHPTDKRLLRLNRAQIILVIGQVRQHFPMVQIDWFRCGVFEMRNGLVLGLTLALAMLAGPSAYAFQKQEGAAAPQAQPQAGAAESSAAGQPLDLSDDTANAGGEKGTEIRIPGLGKLGVLPKMDFGLELLYGAADQKAPAGPAESVPNPDDDIMIRGTVKHRF